MRILSTILTLVVALTIAGNLSAGEKKAGKRAEKKAAEWKVPAVLKDLTLTDQQKEEIKKLDKEFAPKRAEITKKMQSILTEDQKKAQAEAQKQIKAEGKKGKEAKETLEAAVKLDDKQKEAMAEARKELGAVSKEFMDKVKGLLTDEQKEQLKKAHPGHEKKAKTKTT